MKATGKKTSNMVKVLKLGPMALDTMDSMFKVKNMVKESSHGLMEALIMENL